MTEINFDENGNELIYNQLAGTFHLALKSESGRKRLLGEILTRDVIKWFVSKRNREKHFYLNDKARGFNFGLMEELKQIDVKMLSIKLPEAFIWIPLKEAMEVCTYLNYKRSGFELQCFVKEEFFNVKEL